MHIYDCTNKHLPELASNAEWKDMKKSKNLYPSVTTILKYLPNDFINDIWKPQKYIDLAREYPDLNHKEITAKTWGELPDVETKEIIPSSDFGSRGHKALEELAMKDIDEDYKITSPDAWLDFVKPTFDLMYSKFDPMRVEHAVCYDAGNSRFCGTIDLLCGLRDSAEKSEDYELCLVDYKFRKNISTYQSDVCQLAIESFMIKQNLGLSYLPRIYSMLINVATGKPKLIEYNTKKTADAALLFMSVAEMVCRSKEIV